MIKLKKLLQEQEEIDPLKGFDVSDTVFRILKGPNAGKTSTGEKLENDLAATIKKSGKPFGFYLKKAFDAGAIKVELGAPKIIGKALESRTKIGPIDQIAVGLICASSAATVGFSTGTDEFSFQNTCKKINSLPILRAVDKALQNIRFAYNNTEQNISLFDSEGDDVIIVRGNGRDVFSLNGGVIEKFLDIFRYPKWLGGNQGTDFVKYIGQKNAEKLFSIFNATASGYNVDELIKLAVLPDHVIYQTFSVKDLKGGFAGLLQGEYETDEDLDIVLAILCTNGSGYEYDEQLNAAIDPIGNVRFEFSIEDPKTLIDYYKGIN